MRNQEYLLAYRQALQQISQLLAQWSQDPHHERLLLRSLDKIQAEFMADQVIPALTLPTLTWQALKQPESKAQDLLNATHLLFYAFLDITDDVEDQDLQTSPWQVFGPTAGPALATNVGSSLLFLSMLMLDQFATLDLPQQQVNRLKMGFMQAGWLLTVGQHRDLASFRIDQPPEGVLTTHRLKTGTSVRWYMESTALLANAPAEICSQLAEFGETLGMMLQLWGDWMDVQDSISADFANHCQNYPLTLLKHRLSEEDRPYYAALQASAEHLPAHWGLKQLLKKYQIEAACAEPLEALRQQAQANLKALQDSGYDTWALNRFLKRISPLQQASK